MKKVQWKDFLREIRKSLNRYLSIIFIVALGVAFYAGVRSAEPDMEMSVDAYYDNVNLMDIQVLGSLGLTEEDLKAVKSIEGITKAEGAYHQDVLFQEKENEKVISVFSICNSMNYFTVKEGRFPKSEKECFMDAAFMEENEYQIGDTVTIASGKEEALEEALTEETYTIVGSGTYGGYLTWDRGTTSIGNGSVDYFMAVLPESFSMEVYSAIYATVDSADSLQTYSEAYEEKISDIIKKIEEIADGRCQIRYASVKGEALEKVEEAEQEIIKAKHELSEGEQEIQDARKKINEGKKKISEQDKKLQDAKLQLDEGERELEAGKKQLAAGQEAVEKAQEKLIKQEKKLSSGELELKEQEQMLKEGKEQLSRSEQEKEQLQEASEGLKTVEGYQYAIMRMELLKEEKKEDLTKEQTKELAFYQQILPNIQNSLKEAGLEQRISTQVITAIIDGIFAEYDTKLQQQAEKLETGNGDLIKAKAEIAKGRQKLQGAKKQLNEKEIEINEKQVELEEAEKELNKKKEEWKEGKTELNKAKKELGEKEEEFTEVKSEFLKQKNKAEKEIKEGEEKIADGRKEINEIEKAEWYVLDRNSIQTYVEYGMDAEKIGAIGKIFPVIFFLVAALVSLTTMTRMVEDERTQIGILKALGYGNLSISLKYILYALSASLIGGIIGVLAGSQLLPKVIIAAYAILYVNLQIVVTPVHWDLSLISIGIAVFCTVFATVAACYKEFLEVPSNLMRPTAPKQGKRVLLERVPFLWKRLQFTSKATVRNLLRYKKRFFMTVLGIGGCMALLLVGFGLRDSIAEIVNKQYTNVWNYDIFTVIEKKDGAKQAEELEEVLKAYKGQISGGLLARQTSIDVESKNGYLFVPESLEQLNQFVIFADRISQEPYTLSEDGVIVTEKLAKMLKVKSGDTIYLKDGNTKKFPVKITAITQNYLHHYIYITPKLYEDIYGLKPEYNRIFYKLKDISEKQQQQLGQSLLKIKGIKSVTYVKEQEEQVKNMMHSLDLVVWVLIGAAGLLAFIVLYNLNNINMIERRRELATIKVLGFYDVELAEYVYRENILLTIVGMGVGILMGMVMHKFVIETCEIEAIMFGRDINVASYLFSILLTIVFAVLVNGWMYFKLKKIDMVESLKSIE